MISLALFIIFLDGSIVNIALPNIIREYRIDLETASWVINAYTITVAVFLVTMGKIGDLLGKVRFYNLGLGFFMVSSLLCAISPNEEMLIASRFLQGLSGAIVIPTSMSLVRTAVPPAKVGSAMGIWGAVGGLAIAVGPSIGGVIASFSDWRWIFYMNLPVIAIALILNRKMLRNQKEERKPLKLDYLGICILSVTLFILIYTIMKGQEHGWLSLSTLGGFVFASIGGIFFYVVERKVSHPLVDLNLFRNRLYVLGIISNLLGGILLTGMMMILPIFLTEVWKLTPLEAAYTITPLSAAMLIAAPLTGKLIDRFGYLFPMLIGYVMCIAGLTVLTGIDSQTPLSSLLWRIGVSGVGIAIIAITSLTVSTVAVRQNEASLASGIFAMVRNFGGAIGVSLFVSVTLTSFHHLTDVTVQESIGKIQAYQWSLEEKKAAVDALNSLRVSFSGEHDLSRTLVSTRLDRGEWKNIISTIQTSQLRNKETAIQDSFQWTIALVVLFSISAVFLPAKKTAPMVARGRNRELG